MNFLSLFRIREYLLGLFIAGVCIFLHCSVQLAGGTSTTDNPKVVGMIIGDDNRPAPNTQVVLLPENFDPVRDTGVLVADTTDDLGRFVLPVFHQGVFNVQAVNLVKMTRSLIRGVVVEAGNDSVNVADDTLKPSGSVMVELPDPIDRANGYLYVPGTTLFTFLAGAPTRVMLDSAPATTLPAVCYNTENATAPAVLRYDVRVFPGAATLVAMPGWKYSARLSLNTTASGAGVAGNVVNFPALVRLNGGNFIFGQALTNGGDVRFTKENGTPLPCEIERWDPAAGLAEAWVRVDTVRGNDSSQAITMYWGNPAATSESGGAAVFDSTGGFEGVWHLNETSGATAADVSQNGYSGTFKIVPPKNANGPTGVCLYLGPQDSGYVDMGDVLNQGMNNITIGVWIKRASFGLPQALIAKTVGGAPSATYGYQLSIDQANFPHFFMASGGTSWGNDGAFDIASNLAISDSTAWHFILVVIDRSINGNCRMYIDGIDRTGGAYGNVANVSAVTNTLHLRIGSENNTYHFYGGAIGEATIAFAARSADWVKLSYMNQKEQDVLVEW